MLFEPATRSCDLAGAETGIPFEFILGGTSVSSASDLKAGETYSQQFDSATTPTSVRIDWPMNATQDAVCFSRMFLDGSEVTGLPQWLDNPVNKVYGKLLPAVARVHSSLYMYAEWALLLSPRICMYLVHLYT